MRFVLDLWPDGGESMTPGEAVRYAISRIRDNGENLTWQLRSDVTDEVIADSVGPEDIHQPLVDSPVLLVYGDPAEGFHFIGPVTPNDPKLDAFVDSELRNVTWWYVPINTLSEIADHWWVEPLSGPGVYGPFSNKIEASEFMDRQGLSDRDHKTVYREDG